MVGYRRVRLPLLRLFLPVLQRLRLLLRVLQLLRFEIGPAKWAGPIFSDDAGQMGRDGPQVVIAGGGMVGLTLSVALAQGGLEVLLADPLPVASTLSAQFD